MLLDLKVENTDKERRTWILLEQAAMAMRRGRCEFEMLAIEMQIYL